MRVLRKIGRGLTAVAVLALARGRRPEPWRPPTRPAGTAVASAVVLALLALASICSGAFAVFYLLGGQTQLLGLSIGLAFAFFSAAALVAGKALVPQLEDEEETGPGEHPDERAAVVEIVHEAGEGVSRRKLLVAAAGGSAGVCGAALLLPAASLGPVLDTRRLTATMWRPGRPLVDEHGRRVLADDLVIGSFVAAFAEGADPKSLEASLMVVRVRPDELRLPPERADWAPDGIVAFSRICTHAACAVTEFDYPTFPTTSPRARLVCPCHYSAFDVGGGGDVLEGPAGRPLPQLPLTIAADRSLRAAGELSGPPGPSWSGVRE